MFAVGQNSSQRDQVRQLIATLRKAFAQQKRLEDSCNHDRLAIDYRWSLNQLSGERSAGDRSPPQTLNDQ